MPVCIMYSCMQCKYIHNMYVYMQCKILYMYAYVCTFATQTCVLEDSANGYIPPVCRLWRLSTDSGADYGVRVLEDSHV